ncbi:MAG: FixH family protein [Magnetococcales bacterium]|nr:FixH family protein [Magnetococcales bacterium]
MNPTVPSSSPPAEGRRIEPWLAAIFGLFFVVFIANGTLVYLANSSWNGVTVKHAYDEGLAYNQVLAAQQAQEALGWKAELDGGGLRPGAAGTLSFRLLDRSGQPVTGAVVSGILFRPVHEGVDQPLTFVESAPGSYQAALTPPLPGWWDVKLTAKAPGGEFRYAQRLRIAAP